MARLRTQFSIARLLVAVLLVALALSGPFPWQMVVLLSIGMLIPVFVSGLTPVEVAIILATSFVLGTLFIPPIITNCYPKARARAAAAATATVAPQAPSSGRR